MRTGAAASLVILIALIASPLHLSELPPPPPIDTPTSPSLRQEVAEQAPDTPEVVQGATPASIDAEPRRAESLDEPMVTVVEPEQPRPAYDSSPLDLEAVNTLARASLINILCIGTPPLKSTSGTGILIGPDGTILTNAHIGQYVLLSDAGASITCVARIGSPATAEWSLETVFFPPKWAEKHAQSLTETLSKGTGEDDYAILRTVREASDTHELPYLRTDDRIEALSDGSHVLAAYPAEFMSGADVRRFLNAQSTYVTIKDIYTFSSGTVDVVSLGSNPLAQQGSSGGALVNPWGYLIGLITTTTVGKTTGERDLRAITLGHVNRSLAPYGLSLAGLISREPSALHVAAEATARAANYLKAALPSE